MDTMYIVILVSIFMLVLTFLIDLNEKTLFLFRTKRGKFIAYMISFAILFTVHIVLAIYLLTTFILLFVILNAFLIIFNAIKVIRIYKNSK